MTDAVKELELLFEQAYKPMASPEALGAFYRGWRLMSVDGTTLDVADTPENEAEFGRPGTGRGAGVGALPQLRLVGVAECGTHAVVGAAMGPCSTGETTLARGLLRTPLRHSRVLDVLHNPRYAGAFVYGRLRQRKGPDGKLRIEKLHRDQWTSLIAGAHPGYIAWETFELNQKLLAANAQAHGADRAKGPAREGSALLQGLAVCGRCGCRMTVHYHSRRVRGGPRLPLHARRGRERRAPLYVCARRDDRRRDRQATPRHRHAAGPGSRAHRPSRARSTSRRGRRLAPQPRRARPAPGRAGPPPLPRRRPRQPPRGRQPRSRLERRPPSAPRRPRRLRTGQFHCQRSLHRRAEARVRALASDFPRLWSDPATPQRERKRMARLAIEDVTINKSDKIDLHVRFRGGKTTSLTVPVPPTGWQARQTDPQTLALLDKLLDDHTDAQAAELLNQAGHRSGMGKLFTGQIVLHLRRSNGLPSHLERLRAKGLFTIPEIAERLGVSTSTVKAWDRAGLLVSHQASDKNIRLFEPPTPGDPRLVKKMGSSLAKRVPTQP